MGAWPVPVLIAACAGALALAGAMPARALAPGSALRAGAASVDITPDPVVERYTLGGYFAPNRLMNPATGVRDACRARALVAACGGERCAIVSVELCFLPGSLRAAVLERVRDVGIPPQSVFIAATHTHSAIDPLCLHSGMVGAPGRLPAYSPRLQAWFADRIAGVIREAWQGMRPARLGAARMQKVGLNVNRRGEGLTDDVLTTVRVDGVDAAPIATVCLYAAHPTILSAENLQVSGDWCGEFQRQMEAGVPGSVALFLNGSEGDAAAKAPPAATPGERVDAYAKLLAGKALRLRQEARIAPGPVRLGAWEETVRMPARSPHPGFLFAAIRAGATQAQARALVDRILPDRPHVTLLRLGPVLFIGFPGEPTAEIGLAAAARARGAGVAFPAVVALTNEWVGYLISERQYRAGKYEAAMSFYGPRGGAAALDAALRAIDRTCAGDHSGSGTR